MHNYVYVKEFAMPKGVDGFTITDKLPELTKIPAIYAGETWPGHNNLDLDILMSEPFRKKIGAASFGTSDYTFKHNTNCYSKEELEECTALYINPIWILKSEKNAVEAARAILKKFPKLDVKPRRSSYLITVLLKLGIKSQEEVDKLTYDDYMSMLKNYTGDDKTALIKDEYEDFLRCETKHGKSEAERIFNNSIKDDGSKFETSIKKESLYEKSPIAYFARYKLEPEAETCMKMIDKFNGKANYDFTVKVYSKTRQFSNDCYTVKVDGLGVLTVDNAGGYYFDERSKPAKGTKEELKKIVTDMGFDESSLSFTKCNTKQFSSHTMICDSGWENKPNGILEGFDITEIHPDLVLNDNGAYDLEKKGIKGHYVWIGYKHHSKNGSSDHRMDRYVERAAEIISDKYRSAYNEEPVIEDKINTTDMFRVWVQE